MSKKIRFIVAIVFLILAVISYLLYLKGNDKQVYSDELINNESSIFKNNLNAFLLEATNSMVNMKSVLASDTTDEYSQSNLNKILSGLISENKMVKGILLFSKDINYALIKEGATWTTTYSLDNKDTMLDWSRLNENLNVVSQWSDTYNFFNYKNDVLLIPDTLNPEKINLWRTANGVAPEKRKLLVEISSFKNELNKIFLLGLIYKSSEITNNFTEALSFQNPLINILDENGKLLQPVKSSDTAKKDSESKLNAEVDKLINAWLSSENREAKTYSLEADNQFYWTRIDTLDNHGIKGFSITVSEADINNSVSFLARKYLYVSLLFLFIALVFITLWVLSKRRNLPNLHAIEKRSREEIIKLIEGGETNYVEFKSSLRYDYREKKENKILENVILKSISAFANAKGGTLFIGVDDDMNIIGLENDFNTLKKHDADYFELHLNRLINNQFGIRFVNESLLIYFEEFDNKTICIIQISPANTPTYLKIKEKGGAFVEKFYVRSGNSSQQISSLKEINEYINSRFKKD